jgi:hypothetical protein
MMMVCDTLLPLGGTFICIRFALVRCVFGSKSKVPYQKNTA